MKKAKIVVSMLLLVGLISSLFVGCTRKGDSSDPDVQSEKDKTLTFMRAGFDPSNEVEGSAIGIKGFKEKYNKDVQIMSAAWDTWMTKISGSATAGDPIDVFLNTADDYLKTLQNDYMEPIDDYVDMKNPDLDTAVIKDLFSWKGKAYVASSTQSSHPFVIFYNKDKFESEGVDDPLDLYRQGKWDYDAFKAAAKKFTSKDDPDHPTWGYSSFYVHPWYGTNDARLLLPQDDGTLTDNITSQSAIEVFQMLDDIRVTNQIWGCEGDDVQTSFASGASAMLGDYSYIEQEIYKKVNDGTIQFQVGVAPAPYGPSNKNKVNVVHADGYSMGKGCDAPKSAGKLIDLIVSGTAREFEGYAKSYPAEDGALFKELRKNTICTSIFDGKIDNGQQIVDELAAGTPVDSAIATYKQVIDDDIDKLNNTLAKRAD